MSEAHQKVVRAIDQLSPADVRVWLDERLRNCHRIAAMKTGIERDGWLQDAAFFAAAIGLVDWTEAEKNQ